MSKKSVISISDLIKKKESILKREKKKVEVYVEDLDANIVIVEPNRGQVTDMMDRSENGNEFIIAECIEAPNLRDPELMKAYNVKTPVDLVKKLFKHSTIATLSEKIVSIGGYDGSGIKVVEEIKN